MSNFYLDVLKDRLYTEGAKSELRRAAQTTMYIILDAMVRLVSPILAYTSDEIWQYMPHSSKCDKENIVFNAMPEKISIVLDDEFIGRWDGIHNLRDTVKKSIENAVKEKMIRSSLEAKIKLCASGEEYKFIKSVEEELPAAFIVSQVEVCEKDSGDLQAQVLHADGEKCARCWSFSHTVGCSDKYAEICERCANVLSSL